MRNVLTAIESWGSISSLGCTREEVLTSYADAGSAASATRLDGAPVAAIPAQSEERLREFGKSIRKFTAMDRSVQLALYASHLALSGSDLSAGKSGVCIGSARGATGFWEQTYQSFENSGSVSPMSSPLSTLGNLSSHVAQYANLSGPPMDFSVTCSSAFHAIFNAMAWLESGRASGFLAGGTEAPLTGFTLAQMRALKIYSREHDKRWPSRAGDQNKAASSMILGEGAVIFGLSPVSENSLAVLRGAGYATEALQSATGFSGQALYQSMARACKDAGTNKIDLIISHTPGTMLGDRKEYEAIEQLFGENSPPVINNKWKAGHTLGASGALSLELALLILLKQKLPALPQWLNAGAAGKIERIMVNSAGFGGNSASLILSLPQI